MAHIYDAYLTASGAFDLSKNHAPGGRQGPL